MQFSQKTLHRYSTGLNHDARKARSIRVEFSGRTATTGARQTMLLSGMHTISAISHRSRCYFGGFFALLSASSISFSSAVSMAFPPGAPAHL